MEAGCLDICFCWAGEQKEMKEDLNLEGLSWYAKSASLELTHTDAQTFSSSHIFPQASVEYKLLNANLGHRVQSRTTTSHLWHLATNLRPADRPYLFPRLH